jgi:hypothetical protein
MDQNYEILIDYLDARTSPGESAIIESKIQHDKTMAAELEYMKLAIDTVRLGAIRTIVAGVSHSMSTGLVVKTESRSTGIVRSLYKVSLRAAAILVLVLGLSAVYKYISVSNQSLYEKEFTGYELGSSRGLSEMNTEEKAYQEKNWNEVIASQARERDHTNKSNFLAAMAEMQLKQFPKSISLLESIIHSTADNSYREDAEYYISLAYLMNHETDKAIAQLNRIKADPGHSYYAAASKISSIDLKIIELKK